MIIMAFMAVKRNRKKNQTKKNFDEIFKKFDHNQNQRVSVREFTEVGEHTFKRMVGRYPAPKLLNEYQPLRHLGEFW